MPDAPGWYWVKLGNWTGVVQVAYWGRAGGDKLGFFDPTETRLYFIAVGEITTWGPRVPDWP